MPQASKLAKALQIINRTNRFIMLDEVTSILQSLIDAGEYVTDWTAQEIAEFTLEVIK